MTTFSDYQVTFTRDPLIGWWSWSAVVDGKILKGPLLGPCIAKDSAERDAANRITRHLEAETVDGQALVERVAAQT